MLNSRAKFCMVYLICFQLNYKYLLNYYTIYVTFLFLFPESVKSLLGKHVKILLKNVVKLETKGDKTENRVLVSSDIKINYLHVKLTYY